MDFKDLSLSRRSIRSFKPDNISDEYILSIIRSAVYAPSAGNCQPWHFYIINDKEIKQSIAEKACRQSFISTAPIIIVVCTETKRNEQRYGMRGKNLYSIQDTAAAIQNILLQAEDLGLGGCWCGAFDDDILSDMLNLTKDRHPVAVVPIGYPNHKASAPKRRPLDEVMTFIGEKSEYIKQKDNDENVKFEHCNLGRALFNDVNLGDSTFTNINLHNVDISDANLTDGKIHECNLSGMKIYNCLMDGMTINGKDVGELMK